MPRDVGVVLVAAGRGTRLGGETPKQFHPIAGVPMVLRALRPFASHPDVAQVVLVLPAADAAAPPDFLRSLGAGLTIVAGGAARADSVAAGLAALGADCTIVLVHDAARPFVERRVIDAVIAHARGGRGSRRRRPRERHLEGSGRRRPVPRRRAPSPGTACGGPRPRRAFPGRCSSGRYAPPAATVGGHRRRRAGRALGVPVRLVPDSSRNLKVTTPEDLALAELLARRGE